MAKVSAWSLPRPEMPTQKVVLTDPTIPNAPPIEMTLRPLTLPEATSAGERGQEYARLYSGAKADGTAKRFPSPDGAIELGPQICTTLATIEMMQVVDNEEDRYNFGDLVGLSLRMRLGFHKLLEIVAEMMEGGVPLKNPSGAQQDTSQKAPSSSDTPTPSGADSSRPVSGVSTKDSAAGTA